MNRLYLLLSDHVSFAWAGDFNGYMDGSRAELYLKPPETKI